MKTLEIGDMIYSQSSGVGFNARYPILRVTPKRAFIKTGNSETAFNREVANDRLHEVGGPSGSIWNRTYYYLETEEIKTSFEAKKRRWKLETELDKLYEERSNWSNDFMESVIAAMKTPKR